MKWRVAIVMVAAGVALAAMGTAYRMQSCGGGQCASGGTLTAQAGSRDPLMSLVCQRSCAAKEPYRAADLVAQPGAHERDLTRCPVSGVVFRVPRSASHSVYGGRTYYFCCDNCVQKFTARPANFLEG